MFLRRSLVLWAALAGAVSTDTRAQTNGAAPGAVRAEFAAREIAPVTSVRAARARWPELTADDEPVELTGVVTATMPSGAFRMHDGEFGIYATRSAGIPRLEAGERVRVRGVLRKGGFSPWLTPLQVERLGRGEFPAARPAGYLELAAGSADNQWVEIAGVIRSVDRAEFPGFAVVEVGMAGGKIRALVNAGPDDRFEELIDAGVRIAGVAAVTVNRQRHVVEPSFRVPGRSQIEVVRAAPADPFERPVLAVERVLGPAGGAGDPGRRRRAGARLRTAALPRGGG